MAAAETAAPGPWRSDPDGIIGPAAPASREVVRSCPRTGVVPPSCSPSLRSPAPWQHGARSVRPIRRRPADTGAADAAPRRRSRRHRPPTAAQPPADQPTFRAGINFVRVDVIVTDGKGNPVTDLTQTTSRWPRTTSRRRSRPFRLVKIDSNRPVETPPRQLRTRNDEETAAAGRGRAHLRLLPRRLPRAARQQSWRRASR